MNGVDSIFAWFKNIYNFFTTSLTECNGLNEILDHSIEVTYRLGLFLVASFNQYCKPGLVRLLELYENYNAKYEEWMDNNMFEIFVACWNLKTSFAEFTSQYLTAFTVDDFHFFKHHWDDPWAVATHWWYEDLAWYFENFLFDITNFLVYNLLPRFVDFCYDYYIETEHLTYWGVFAFALACGWLIYDYIKTLVEVQTHLHRLDAMQLAMLTEYLRKHKVLYKTKKMQDSFEDRQYNTWGYDRELFIEELITNKELQATMRQLGKQVDHLSKSQSSKFATDLYWTEPNKVEESPIIEKVVDPEAKPEVVIDKTIDPIYLADYPATAADKKRAPHLKEFFRRWIIIDAVHLFDIFDTKEMRFWIFVANLYDLPKNLYKLFTLFLWGCKAFLATSWPTSWTHFDVDYKIYLDIYTITQWEEAGRAAFTKWLLNFLYDSYVQYFNDTNFDIPVLINNYVDYKLKYEWHYRRSSVRFIMKDSTFFFFGLRMQMVWDLLECDYPIIFYFRHFQTVLWNLVRLPFLYCFRIFWRILKMPLFEAIDVYLVKYKIKRITSPLEEASLFGYVPMYARTDIVGYISYLDAHKIAHGLHVSYYKGGKKKSYWDWLKDLFAQFYQFDMYHTPFLFFLEQFWINKYDVAYKYKHRSAFKTYLGARVYMKIIRWVRYYLFRPVNLAIKNFFRKTWTWEMYMFLTFLRFWYESPFYRWYRVLFNFFYLDDDTRGLPSHLEMSVDVRVNSEYTRKMALETMAGKNQNWWFFYFPYINYHMEFMFEDLYEWFDEEDEEIYTYEEDGFEIDYIEDHDHLLESDFQLRKNWKRDLESWFALINEEQGLGLKRTRGKWDFYQDSEQLWGSEKGMWKIGINWLTYIQNTRLPVRETYAKQQKSSQAWREYYPYGLNEHVKNWTKVYSYEHDLAVLEKEAFYLLYQWVNSPVNGFFTPSSEVDDAYYYSYNTIWHDADELLNEDEYIIYQYHTKYAYGPYGLFLDELPTLLHYPEFIHMRRAMRKWRISKKGSRIGRWSYYKNLVEPLRESLVMLEMNYAFAKRVSHAYIDQVQVVEADKMANPTAFAGSADEAEPAPDVNEKIRKRFEHFVVENKNLQSEFNALMKQSYKDKEDLTQELKTLDQFLIGTEAYSQELQRLQKRKDVLKKYFGEFAMKLKEK